MELKKFKKLVIEFNKEGYENAINTLKKTIDIINSYSELNNKYENKLTIQDLKVIANNNKDYKKKVYQNTLKEICDHFCMDYLKVKLTSYTWENPMFSDMANNKAKPLYLMADAIHIITFQCPIVLDFIDIQDNIASPKLNFENELMDYFTRYTENERLNEILEISKKYSDVIKEFNKLNVNIGFIHNLLYSDFSINANTLKQC